MTKKIPALILSGGKLSDFGGMKAAKEFRVWIHPIGHGDDFYYQFDNLKDAKMLEKIAIKSEQFAQVEKPLAVVYDKKFKKYREVVIR